MINIQAASIEVPGYCPNNCPFCVSKVNEENKYFNTDSVLNYTRYISRLEYMKDIGVNCLLLTGSISEPMLNTDFLEFFDYINNEKLKTPFVNLEIQTSGRGLDLDLLKKVEIKTVALSLSSFDAYKNSKIVDMPFFHIIENCWEIKNKGFNLRLTLNMNTFGFTNISIKDIIFNCSKLKADQVTIRYLYSSEKECKQNCWIVNNRTPISWFEQASLYLNTTYNKMTDLSFGPKRYSVEGMSFVIDEDCMNKQDYLILRKNCKLYTSWSDRASLIF